LKSVADSRFWIELIGFALAIALSPLHIGVLLLLLLGAEPLRRGGWFVAGWLLVSALEMLLLLSVGHGLLLRMQMGSSHRTGLDLLAAGGLLALGLNELLEKREEGNGPSGLSSRLDRFGAMSLPLLLGFSALIQVASPDDLFLYAKATGSLLAENLSHASELLAGGLFTLTTGVLLLLPLLALLVLGQQRVLPVLQRGKDWLTARGDVLVGILCLLLAAYMGWQGIDGLRGV
jgi:hypothetical protein